MDKRAFLAMTVAGFTVGSWPARAETWGHFIGSLIWQALPDGRRMRLVEPYGYLDPEQQNWPVPTNTVVDGASIPRAFWSIIGGPFEGKYRNASVIHDHYCDTQGHTWQATHRTFYKGMRANGVDEIQAKIMFAAVWWKGPRWDSACALQAPAAPPAGGPTPAPTTSAGPPSAACTKNVAAYLLGIALLKLIPGTEQAVESLRAQLDNACRAPYDPTIRLADVEQMQWLAAEIQKTNPSVADVGQLTRVAQVRADTRVASSPQLGARAPVDPALNPRGAFGSPRPTPEGPVVL